MTASPPRLFAVVVSFNGANWIDGCLQSLLGSSLVPAVVVVDNASTDNTVAICARHAAVTVLKTGANLGFGRANNIGIAHAIGHGAGAVLLLNQDARMDPEAIRALVEAHALHPQAGIVGPVQWNADASQLDGTFARHYLAGCAPQLLADALRGQVRPTYTVAALPAAAWLLTPRALAEVGGFDPLFFMYAEDDDYCRRVRRRGLEIVLATQAHFEHARGFHPAARRPTLAKLVRRIRSNVVLDLKNPSRSLAGAVVDTCASALVESTRSLVSERDPRRALAHVAALVGTLVFELFAIRRHRLLGERSGPTWIEGGQAQLSALPAPATFNRIKEP